MPDLRFHIVEPDPRAEAVLAFVFSTLGVAAEAVPPPALWSGPHLVYGEGAGGGHETGPRQPGRGGFVIPKRPGDRLWIEALEGRVDAATLPEILPFDLVSAIAAFLDDDVNADPPPTALDRHDRLTFAASYPVRHGLGDTPIVNVYVELVAQLLVALGVPMTPRWPDGRRAAIVLSHDVDLPDRYAVLRSALRPWRFRRSPRTYARTTIGLAQRRLRDHRPDDFWLFDQLTDSERRLGFRSTFFFATVPFHATLGAPADVAYDAGSARFRRTYRRLAAAGFEVGLHASYRAHEDATRLVAERARLADASGLPIVGVRHHYWHLGPDPSATLRAHEAAGFEYDSSIAFNDHIGFRRSVALPFRPFDRVTGRALRTWQLPTFCMDGNLFYRSSDVEAAVGAVDGAISRIAAWHGFGAIDWHIQTSVPANDEFRAWGIAYQEIIRMLAARSDVWVATFGEVMRWVSGRPGPVGIRP